MYIQYVYIYRYYIYSMYIYILIRYVTKETLDIVGCEHGEADWYTSMDEL